MARKLIPLLFLLTVLTSEMFAQKAKFVASNTGAVINVLNRKSSDGDLEMALNNTPSLLWGTNWIGVDQVSYSGEIDTIFVGIDSGYYKCNTDLTLLMVELPKYKTGTYLVSTDGFNPNKKRYPLEKLKPLKIRKSDEAFLTVKGIELNIAKRRFKQKYYESYKDYKTNKPENEKVSEEELKSFHSVFEKDIDRFLKATNYLDTLHGKKLNLPNHIELDIVVNSITEHKFDRFCVVELNSTIKLPSVFGLLKEKTFITRSDIGFDNTGQDKYDNRRLISSAIENTLQELLSDPLLQEKFIDPEAAQKKMIVTQEIIELKNLGTGTVNLENAVNAVVTVIQKNGHGSGCLVSTNGYIVTNYHVTGADTSEIYVVFNSGSQRRCQFVRGNQTYDLALLKVDTNITMPLKINTSKAINVGSDVYAIGTPNDISLGQTITKGIISAKRTMDGHVFIQSDASVNKGNSGGALTNKDGELIGVVNSKLIGVGVEGVSFAIPAFYLEEALGVKIK